MSVELWKSYIVHWCAVNTMPLLEKLHNRRLREWNEPWLLALTFPKRCFIPSRPAKLSKIRFLWPIFSMSKIEVSSSSQMAKIRSISVYKLVSNVSMYKEQSCRDWSQDSTDRSPHVDTSKPETVESESLNYYVF